MPLLWHESHRRSHGLFAVTDTLGMMLVVEAADRKSIKEIANSQWPTETWTRPVVLESSREAVVYPGSLSVD